MALTEEQIVELAAVKVQKEVLEKVETFTDGVSKNVTNLQLELKDTNQFNSAIMAQLNEVKSDVKKMEPSNKRIDELWTLFCKNGYMKRFNELVDVVNRVTRAEYCPLMQRMDGVEKRVNDLEDKPGREALTRGQRWKGALIKVVVGLVIAAASAVSYTHLRAHET